jgi:site-specific recombinase XerD
MPAFTLREDDPESFRAFVATLDRNDDKTIAAYLTTLRDLAAWLATQPDGTPFHPPMLTVTVLEGYFGHLEAEQRAPRTRAKALTAITRFCRWAIDAGHLQRNPAHQIKRPTVPALSPISLIAGARMS